MTGLRQCQWLASVCHWAAAAAGSLVLGQNQECYGACFSPSQALDGSMAAVRVWDRVLSQASHPCRIAFSCTPINTTCLSKQSARRACEQANDYLCLDLHQFIP